MVNKLSTGTQNKHTIIHILRVFVIDSLKSNLSEKFNTFHFGDNFNIFAFWDFIALESYVFAFNSLFAFSVYQK